jgi:hypothetical protein
MKKTMRTLVAMLAIAIAVGLSAALCIAQQSAATKESSPVKSEAKDRLTIKGKIVQMGSTGYYLQGEDPPGEFMIVNPNEKQLKSLMKKGNTVKVEGYTTVSADRLFVEKIDGKRYRGDGRPTAQ